MQLVASKEVKTAVASLWNIHFLFLLSREYSQLYIYSGLVFWHFETSWHFQVQVIIFFVFIMELLFIC